MRAGVENTASSFLFAGHGSFFPTCTEDGDSYDFSFLISDDEVIIREFRIIGMAWFLEIDV